MNRYIKFVGAYSDLKQAGFTFQKLYASNYMQWEKDGFRVWKKGGDMTIDRYKNVEGELLHLLLANRKTLTSLLYGTPLCGGLQIGINYESYRVKVTRKHISLDDDEWSAQLVSVDTIRRLFTMVDTGFIEVGTL